MQSRRLQPDRISIATSADHRFNSNPCSPPPPSYPPAFRDALFTHFESVSSPTDWDGYAAALDRAGNTLDYRKYSDQLFDILIAGGILAPGGSYEDEDAPLSPFSIFGAKSAKVEDVKPYVNVIDKVIRRYKFLQKPLEETTLTGILQYINRFNQDQNEKLATATALLIQQGLIGANVLKVIQKDHLVKDGGWRSECINAHAVCICHNSSHRLNADNDV